MLVSMMKKLVDLGCRVVYSDTDSIKFYLGNITEDEVMKVLFITNKNTIRSNKNNIRFKTYKEIFKVNENDFNKICRLGIWELETVDKNDKPLPIPYFITFGAKKYGYITSDNKVFTTIAGCNKKNPSIVINNLAKRENISLVDAFKIVLACGTKFDETASGRTTAKRENRSKRELEYYTYKGKRINQYGGTIIENTTYTLNITLNDSKLIGLERADDVIISINLEGVIDYE